MAMGTKPCTCKLFLLICWLRPESISSFTAQRPIALRQICSSTRRSEGSLVPISLCMAAGSSQSPFGKAAIGRNKRTPRKKLGRNDASMRKKKGEIIDATLRTATSTKQVIRRRDNALLAFKTLLNLPLDSSIAILNAYPRLYTHIPDLSDRLSYLLNDINLKPEQLRRMLTSHPRLMERVLMDNENNITNTLEVLQTELDLSVKDIKAIQSKALPAILSYPRSELRKRILVYKLDLGYPKEDITKMVLKDPRMLRTDARNVKQILNVFEEELDIGKEDVRTMLAKEILLLTYNAENNIRPTIRYLKEKEVGMCLGMVERKGISTFTVTSQNEKEVIINTRLKNLIMGNPKVLSASLEKNLKPTVNFFMLNVALSPYEFGRVIYRRGGSLLEANVERTLKRKVSFLRHEMDLEVQVEYEEVHETQGYILTGKKDETDHISLSVPISEKSPESESISLSSYKKKRLIAQMLATNPDILTLSIENNLRPKFRFFLSTVKLSKEQLRYIILKRPQILSLSLERNIIPKVNILTSQRTAISNKDGDLSMETYEGGLGMSMTDLREWITQYPQTITVALESRIKPRIYDVVKLGLEVGIGGQVPLNFITMSDRSWDKWMESYSTEGDNI